MRRYRLAVIMLKRTRITGVQCLALTIGAMLGLLTSVRDLGSLSAPTEAYKPKPRDLSKFPLMYVNLEGSKGGSPNSGIIGNKPGQAPIAKAPKKLKSRPFTIDTFQLGEVVNPHPFEYTLEPSNACRDPHLFLVAYVHTSADHYERRAQIRNTWGKTSLYGDTAVEVYFMLGKASSDDTQSHIADEFVEHQDIVQESFVDAYHNLSYKAIGAMKWVSSRCKQAKFVLKTDDDVFINTFALIKHLKDLDEAQMNNTGLLMCLVWHKMHVLREGKWRIDESVIPDEFYPPYCSGMGYIMSIDVAEAIHKASAYVPFFWVDDVYITGQIPKKIKLEHVDIVKLFMGRKEIEWLLTGNDWHKYIFSHLRDMDFYLKMWKILEERALKDEIPDVPQLIAGTIAIGYGPKKPPEERKPAAMKKTLDRKSLKIARPPL